MSDARPLLQVDSVVMTFGGLTALLDISFEVPKGAIKSVIGPNGAGKTTLFNIITGAFAPTEGEVVFNEEPLTGLKAHQVAARGIARTFQTVELFGNMTVLENVMTGGHLHLRSPFVGAGLRWPGIWRQQDQARDSAMELLSFVGLANKADDHASALPLGEQKILEIARAMAVRPELICLDEPAAGLNETETERASEVITAIRDRGITVLLVEHDMKLVMQISDAVMVINYGSKIADGTPDSVRSDAQVIEAYLGADGGHHAAG